MTTRLWLLSGTGNRFAVLDAIHGGVPADTSALARAVCAPGAIDPRPDGLLLVLPPRSGGDVRMELVNADGSRPETCGNGLRCVAKVAFEHAHVRSEELLIEDDAGLHRARVSVEHGRVVEVSVSMGRPRVLSTEEHLQMPVGSEWDRVHGARVDVGNPHFVLFFDDVHTETVVSLGPALERHPAFPAGTNVEFVWTDDEGGRRIRVWERGVGETEACGSGTCAVAAAEQATQGFAFGRYQLPGGLLSVEIGGDGVRVLSGAVADLGWRAWPAGTRASAQT